MGDLVEAELDGDRCGALGLLLVLVLLLVLGELQESGLLVLRLLSRVLGEQLEEVLG